MNDKRRKYAAVVSAPPELFDRYPTATQRIEEELVYKLTEPIVTEAIKGECIVRFSETEQQQDFTTDLIESRKYVYIEEVVRCKDCRHYNHGELWGRSWDFCDYNENCCDLSVDPESDFCSRGVRKTAESE